MADLTPRQALFVRAYTSPEALFNGTEAARLAKYKGNDNTLATMAHRMLRLPKIHRAIRDRMHEQFDSSNLTVERVLEDLELTRQGAIRDGQWSVAAKCSELHGKYLKMFIDRVEHVRQIDDVSTDELGAMLGNLIERLDGVIIPGGARGDSGEGSAESSDADSAGAPTTH